MVTIKTLKDTINLIENTQKAKIIRSSLEDAEIQAHYIDKLVGRFNESIITPSVANKAMVLTGAKKNFTDKFKVGNYELKWIENFGSSKKFYDYISDPTYPGFYDIMSFFSQSSESGNRANCGFLKDSFDFMTVSQHVSKRLAIELASRIVAKYIVDTSKTVNNVTNYTDDDNTPINISDVDRESILQSYYKLCESEQDDFRFKWALHSFYEILAGDNWDEYLSDTSDSHTQFQNILVRTPSFNLPETWLNPKSIFSKVQCAVSQSINRDCKRILFERDVKIHHDISWDQRKEIIQDKFKSFDDEMNSLILKKREIHPLINEIDLTHLIVNRASEVVASSEGETLNARLINDLYTKHIVCEGFDSYGKVFDFSYYVNFFGSKQKALLALSVATQKILPSIQDFNLEFQWGLRKNGEIVDVYLGTDENGNNIRSRKKINLLDMSKTQLYKDEKNQPIVSIDWPLYFSYVNNLYAKDGEAIRGTIKIQYRPSLGEVGQIKLNASPYTLTFEGRAKLPS